MRKLHSERTRIERYGEDGTLPRATTDALLEWSSALHPNEPTHAFVWPDGEPGEFAIGTVQGYLREMRKVVERAFPELLTVEPAQFNDEMDAMHTGENPYVPEGGLAKTSLMKTQCAARTFFWYHGISPPDEIIVYGQPSEPKHDEADLLTRADVLALRAHVEGIRNRALLEMFLNTGQRISAIQGLRIMDVDVEHNAFYLNTEWEGLKGAEKRGRWRPLFGATPYLANWLDARPLGDDPDAYVFIGDLDHHYTKPDQPLCQNTTRRMLQFTANCANVKKPVNPHNFRHSWTTMMKQDYGLNDEEIKFLLGHGRRGNGVNVVYNHSTDERLRANAVRTIEAIGEPEPKPLTPEQCAVCDEAMDAHWIRCPVCETLYGPRRRGGGLASPHP